MSQQRAEYVARINRVIDYIERHLDEELSLARLAEVANFSRFHFHRVFGAMVGETLGQFIQRLRVEKAATLLLANPKKSITTIALECGFSGSAPFARAFKATHGLTASQWRSSCGLTRSKIRQAERNHDQAASNLGQESPLSSHYLGSDSEKPRRYEMPAERSLPLDVKVEELPDRHVAYVRHVGPYKGNVQLFEELFGRLMRWAGPRGLCTPEAKVMSVYHDNTDITDEDKLRVSACLTVPEGTPVDGEVGAMVVPGGRFAVAHFEITDTDQYAEAWEVLMLDWLPDSGYQPDDRLCFEDYLNDPNEDSKGTHIFDICVPVKPL